MNIVIVTDAWYPQINGVVRTLARTRDELLKLGHTVPCITPEGFQTVPMPTYPDIRRELRRPALVPRARGGGHGRHRDAAPAADRTRLYQSRHLVARRG